MNGRKIVGIGETVLDIVLKDGRPMAAVPGGSTFNSLVSLGRSAGRRFPDVDILMATRTGDDAVADIVISFLEENHIGSGAVQRSAGRQTPVSLAMLDGNNDARYEFFRDRDMPPFEIPSVTFGHGDFLLFGSFFAVGGGTGAAVSTMLDRARSAGATVYYDVNFRGNHIAELPSLRSAIDGNCSKSDIVRASSEDISIVCGTDSPSEAYGRYFSKLCRNFICTCGAMPTEVFSGGRRFTFETEKVETVSTIGAGDAFNAGFIYAMLSRGTAPECLDTLDREEWGRLVAVASAFSGEVCRSIYNYIGPDFVGSLTNDLDSQA